LINIDLVSIAKSPQVDRLSDVLRERYNFKVTEKKLNTRKKAQLQISKHLSKFVHDEDDDDTLFIIYYAGHGTPDQSTGRLLLAK
jgi:Caspase domain